MMQHLQEISGKVCELSCSQKAVAKGCACSCSSYLKRQPMSPLETKLQWTKIIMGGVFGCIIIGLLVKIAFDL